VSEDDELIRERRGSVLVARLNRPAARNALSPSLMNAIGAALLEGETEQGIRAVVLTGTGDRAFCAGMDMQQFTDGEEMVPSDDQSAQAFYRFLRGEVGVPVVGAANATAVAGGFELLLGCDVIVASSAAKFGLPEVKRGLFPAGGGTRLGTRIPLSIALEMVLTGDSIDAGRAYELGLVNTVVAPDEVLPAAISYADRIAANGPLGVSAAKELVLLGIVDPARTEERLRQLQVEVFASQDAREGALAFLEKRSPSWQGR
jgi:enoyl-CoA hydratase/carnithine racemase